MPGPAPKDPESRARRNKPSTAGVVVEASGAQAPTLGTKRADGKPWHGRTRRWWREIWASGLSGRWIDAHAGGLRMLAELVDDFWQATSPADRRAIHAEVRLASREFGLSLMALRSMGIEVRRPVAAEPPPKGEPLPPGADPRKVLSIDQRRTG
jgi:hypothetical protein